MLQMRRAGILVWNAHRLAGEAVKPGVTTHAVDMVIEDYFDSHRAAPLFKGVAGKIPFPASTCISVNEEVVHGIPSMRVLKEGDIISVDTGCKLDGWCADAAFTHAVGRVSSEVQRLLDITSGALDLAIDLMGKKSRWSEVAREMATYVRDAGFSVVENFVGHGIGATCTKIRRCRTSSALSCGGTTIFAWSRGWSLRSSRWSTWGRRR